MATITISNVFKRYGDGFPAVNDVSLDINDGELMILVGPSGCGKSTLLRMIAGLEDISDGEIAIDGKRVNEKSPRDRNLAMVFQNYALYPHLSVFENIAFPLRLRKDLPNDEITKRVEKAAETLEATEHLQRKPGQLSGGQRQRVAMGRAIVRSVDAFLFDEPLSNLDAKLRGQMRTEIHRLQRRMATTTVYVTHDQTEAMTLGDRVAVLRKGVLQQCATPRELYENPVNLFVAGFIGSPPMNFIPAVIEGNNLKTPLLELEMQPEAKEVIGDRKAVLIGIRPEHVEDLAMVEPSKRSQGVSFRAHVDVTEWLGDRKYAYLPYDVEHGAAMEQELAQLEEELDSERLRSQFVVALDPMSEVSEGGEAELWLDRSRVLVFDPENGDNITRKAIDLRAGEAATSPSQAAAGSPAPS